MGNFGNAIAMAVSIGITSWVMLRGIDGLWVAIEAHQPRAQCAGVRAQFDAHAHRLAGRAT
jgi:hypothetical protein